MKEPQPLLQTAELSAGYHAGRRGRIQVAEQVQVEIGSGQLICLLGPNGSGKSTLLRTLAGLQPPLGGKIRIGGLPAARLTPAQLARQISLVLTDSVRSSNLHTDTLVALGRYPYSGWLGTLNEKDKEIIAAAVEAAGIGALLGRKVATLSDGECQKVMLARALAQDTPLLMLDEPTAHLDLPSRIQLMRLLLQLTRQTGKGILLSTHELDLALQVADQVWLLSGDGHLQSGAPEDLVLNGAFSGAFNRDGIVFDQASGSFPLNQAHGEEIGLEGSGTVAFWTRRALERAGYTVHSDRPEIGLVTDRGKPAPAPDQSAGKLVRVRQEGATISWELQLSGKTNSFTSIGALLHALQIH